MAKWSKVYIILSEDQDQYPAPMKVILAPRDPMTSFGLCGYMNVYVHINTH